MNGLSFKVIQAATINEINAKVTKAKEKGWKTFGETTKEEKAPGFFQVMAKYKITKKKNETESKVT